MRRRNFLEPVKAWAQFIISLAILWALIWAATLAYRGWQNIDWVWWDRWHVECYDYRGGDNSLDQPSYVIDDALDFRDLGENDYAITYRGDKGVVTYTLYDVSTCTAEQRWTP